MKIIIIGYGRSSHAYSKTEILLKIDSGAVVHNTPVAQHNDADKVKCSKCSSLTMHFKCVETGRLLKKER